MALRTRNLAKKRATIGNEFGELLVQRRKRCVRITTITKPKPGERTGPGVGYADLDDASVDRLIQRLQAIRGGRRALQATKQVKKVLTHLGMGHRVIEMGAKTSGGPFYYCTVCKERITVYNVSSLSEVS